MIKVILFDFFDVIHRDHQKAWLAANGFKREGGFAEASDLLDRGEINFDEYLERYGKSSGRPAETVRQEINSYSAVDEAVVGLIKELRSTYITCLVSNAHSNELRPILERYDLHELFNEIFISSEVGIAKPDPRIFMHVVEKLQVQPEDCVFIDDNPVNIQAAQEVGMQGIVFKSDEDLRNDLLKLGIPGA